MVLQCYTWILDLFWQIICDYDDVEYFANLPDDLIENILSRLPTESVIQCRKVCKRWWMLTWSSYFIELHQTMGKPLTLMHKMNNGYFSIFIVDDKGRKKECDLGFLNKICFGVSYISSCNGLVLLFSNIGLQYHVLNPLSAKVRYSNIYTDARGSVGLVMGFYFHHLAKEYRILWLNIVENVCEYHIYLFGANMWRQIATPSFFLYPNNGYYRDDRDAAIVNRCLHWYRNNGIAIFDIISEAFSRRPLPIEECINGGDLLVKEDRLCFFNKSSQKRAMDIWVLEDYENWRWFKKYVVDLNWDVNKYPMRRDHVGYEADLRNISVISIHKNELMLFWRCRGGLFSYNLAYNTIKKIRVKVELGGDDIDRHYGSSWGYRAFK